MCDYTLNRPLVSVFLLLVYAISTALTFPLSKSPSEVKVEKTGFLEPLPATWSLNLFNSVTSTAAWKPAVLTVSEGDPFVLSCLKGSGTKCTSSSNCKVTWFKARNKKHLMALRPWTASRLLEKSGALKYRDLQGSFGGYHRGEAAMVVQKATKEHAGLYICRVSIEGSEWKKALGVTQGFERKFLVRVTSKGSGAPYQEEALMSNEIGPRPEEAANDHESEEHPEEPPVALEFGILKYVFGLGSMVANLAFFGVCLTLLPCLCCSGLSSLCCCF